MRVSTMPGIQRVIAAAALMLDHAECGGNIASAFQTPSSARFEDFWRVPC